MCCTSHEPNIPLSAEDYCKPPWVGGPSVKAHWDVSQAVLRGQSQGSEQGGDLRMIRPLSEG